MRVPRLRPRRPARPLRGQLHRPRSGVDAAALVRAVPVQGAAVACGPPGLPGAQEPALPQSRRRHVRRMSRSSRASPARAAPTRSASRRSTSTTTAGSTSTSPTTRIRARSIATTATAPSPTSRPAPGAPTARTASRRPAWASPSATTIATARWTSSRPTSPATRRRCTRTPGKGLLRGSDVRRRYRRSTPAGWAGASASSISTATAGSICSSSTATSIPKSRQLKTEAGYEQRKVVYRNLRNGKFADVTEQLGAPVTTPKAGAGRGVRGLRQRRRRRRPRQQPARHAGPISASIRPASATGSR